jgi:histidyl-tRNA synthetase
MYSISGHLLDQVCVIVDKLGRLSRDEIQRELFSTGLLSEAVQAIIQVLSLKSLTELDEVLGSHVGERNGDHELFFCEVVVFFFMCRL